MGKLFLPLACASALALAWSIQAGAQEVPQTGTPAPATQPGATTPQEGSTDRTAMPAQEADGDIVVTAQRRAERVVDVPISITVASQAQLERQQVNTVNDLNRIAPSLEIQAAPGQNTGGGGAIRGIGTQTFNQGATASVGIVVDQVSQGNANVGDLFDVARIEVLKGPQGTLFGLTTSAGVINITTNAPDPTRYEVRARTELSGANVAGSKFGNQIVQGIVNVPLSDTAAVRVSGFTNLRQGVNINSNGHYNDINRYGGRARLLWRPTDKLTFNLIGDYSYSTSNGEGDFFTFTRTAGPGERFFAGVDPVGITARLASCGVTPQEGNQTYCSANDVVNHTYNYGVSGQVDYDAGPFTLTSISAYRENKANANAGNIFRADPLILQVTNGAQHSTLSLLTQEFRVTSPANQFLEYTIGAFLSRQRGTGDPQPLNVTLQLAPGVAIPATRALGSSNAVGDDSMAVFGQGTVHLTRALRLIAGARYTGERLTLNGYNYGSALGGGAYGYGTRDSTDQVSYRFGAQYDLMHNAMIYATASRGYKGGQITVPTDPTQPPRLLLPEIPQSYEAGLKATLFGGWIADLNGFYEKIGNFQAQQCLSNPATGALSCSSTNIDGVKSRGAELDFFGRVTHDLSLNTGFIYTKATYPSEFLGSDGSNIGDSQLALSPRYKFTLSGEYEHPLGERLKGFVSADTVWKSRIRYEANSVGESTFRPHWMVGGRLGVRTADDRFTVAAFVRNLFNVHEPVLLQSGFPYNGGANIGAIYGPMSYRQVGISLDGRF